MYDIQGTLYSPEPFTLMTRKSLVFNESDVI